MEGNKAKVNKGRKKLNNILNQTKARVLNEHLDTEKHKFPTYRKLVSAIKNTKNGDNLHSEFKIISKMLKRAIGKVDNLN